MLLTQERPRRAPGIYVLPDEPVRELTGVRMDVCAFVGVAPRGPARETVLDEITRNCKPDPRVTRKHRRTLPIAVESFDQYRRLYGGFEGPGLLPYSVASFFEQGGRRAYIARIVHEFGPADEPVPRIAAGIVAGASTSAGPLVLRARNEGAWGNRLRARISFRHVPIAGTALDTRHVGFGQNDPVHAGTLLRFSFAGGYQMLTFVTEVRTEGLVDQPGRLITANLETPLPSTAFRAMETVEADLVLDDGDGRSELHERQGLSRRHPKWLAATLAYESELVVPDDSWQEADITPDAAAKEEPFAGGQDAFDKITPDDFFDRRWTFGDDEPGDGVHCLVNLPDLSVVVVPDLYAPWPLAAVHRFHDESPKPDATFRFCLAPEPVVVNQEFPAPDLNGLWLSPQTDLDAIIGLQQKLVEFASEQQSFIVLIDVPPGLTRQRILYWLTAFDSRYAAAYHPWLKTGRLDDRRDELVRIPPSAVAAGILAKQELAFGVPHGPANAIAVGFVDVQDAVSPLLHDELHPLGINVYLKERDGIRLTAARTLSREPEWRQLSVRRIVTMIRRTLEQQTQWIAFEPNHSGLRSELRVMLSTLLGRLFRAGAFQGATEEEAFFVHCDEALNPRSVVERGQLIADIGIAPAEPIEFIVLRLRRGGDGTFTIEE